MTPIIGWGELRGNGQTIGPVRYRIAHPQGSVWGDNVVLSRAAQSHLLVLAMGDRPPVRVRLRLGARGMATVQLL